MSYLTNVVKEIYTTFRDGINYLINGNNNFAYARIGGDYSPVTLENDFLHGLDSLVCFSKREKGGKSIKRKQIKRKERETKTGKKSN